MESKAWSVGPRSGSLRFRRLAEYRSKAQSAVRQEAARHTRLILSVLPSSLSNKSSIGHVVNPRRDELSVAVAEKVTDSDRNWSADSNSTRAAPLSVGTIGWWRRIALTSFQVRTWKMADVITLFHVSQILCPSSEIAADVLIDPAAVAASVGPPVHGRSSAARPGRSRSAVEIVIPTRFACHRTRHISNQTRRSQRSILGAAVISTMLAETYRCDNAISQRNAPVHFRLFFVQCASRRYPSTVVGRTAPSSGSRSAGIKPIASARARRFRSASKNARAARARRVEVRVTQSSADDDVRDSIHRPPTWWFVISFAS